MMLTESQAAELIQVDKRTIRRLVQTGRLRAINIGCGSRVHYRIDPEDLRQILPPETPRAGGRTRARTAHRPPSSLAAYLPNA